MGYWIFYTCLYILPGIFQDYKDFPSIYIIILILLLLYDVESGLLMNDDEWLWIFQDYPGILAHLYVVRSYVHGDKQWTNHGVSMVSGGVGPLVGPKMAMTEMIRRWGPWTGGEHLVSPIGAG